MMHERWWRGDEETRRRSRDAVIDRRALEIQERWGCDWVEAWARAQAEHDLADGREQIADSPNAQRRIGRARPVPGRVTLSDQIGIAMRPLSRSAPGRTTLSAALPAVRSTDMASGALDPLADAMSPGRRPVPMGLPMHAVAPSAAIQMQSNRATAQSEAAEMLGAVIESIGSGQPLPEVVRRKMERVFGADFSAVRIHEGPQAVALGALAYARGTDIYFAPGQYDPESRRGQELLGHELAHVVQQAQGRVKPTTQAQGVGINESSVLESEADELGAKAAAGPAHESEQGTPGTTAAIADVAVAAASVPAPLTRLDRIGAAFDAHDVSRVRVAAGVDAARGWDAYAYGGHLAAHQGQSAEGLPEQMAGGGSRAVVQYRRPTPVHRTGVYTIRSSAGATVRTGTSVTFSIEQVETAIEPTGATHTYQWSVDNDPTTQAEAARQDPRYQLHLEGPRNVRTWTVVAQVPGTHHVHVTVLLDGREVGHASFAQTVTADGRTVEHQQIAEAAGQTRVATGTEEWSAAHVVAWQAGGAQHRQRYIHEFKRQWVRGYREVITEAARQNQLPVVLIGGVAYNEVAGDPPFIDDVAYPVRQFDHLADPMLEPITITRRPELTSFGDVSMQLRRAAETLGYEPERLTSDQEAQIRASLTDHRQSVFIAARHLAELRDIDFRGRDETSMTQDEIKVTATRFNRGPDLSLARIRENLSYGETIIRRWDELVGLLHE